MFDDALAAIAADLFPPQGQAVNPWPFPQHPPTPWTKAQEQAYQQSQRAQLPEAPL